MGGGEWFKGVMVLMGLVLCMLSGVALYVHDQKIHAKELEVMEKGELHIEPSNGVGNKPRFKKLLAEESWEVWHDEETGQEIVCRGMWQGSKSINCFQTGRHWR